MEHAPTGVAVDTPRVDGPSDGDLARFVYREARLIDEKKLDDWFALFTDDAFYWVPLTPGQTDPLNHTSLMYEDTLLLRLRVERLKSPRAYSQQPASRCHHLLAAPEVESRDPAANLYRTRTQLIYTETRGDEEQRYAATVFHTLTVQDHALRIRLKRVDLLNCDAALPSIQLFP